MCNQEISTQECRKYQNIVEISDDEKYTRKKYFHDLGLMHSYAK